MHFLIFASLFLQCVFLECYGSYKDSYAMSLKTEQNLPSIARFINAPRDMPESSIKHDWYKRDQNNELLDESESYTDNILRILLDELIKRFEKNKEDRVDTIIEILEFLNDFIRERFIPTHHQHAITKVFSHVIAMQHKPVMHFESLVFDKLSESAKEKFKEGVRVQTKDLERAEQNYSSNQFELPDPELVEILFMQLICDAVESSETRQWLINQSKETMAKLDKFFGSDPKYKIVGSFNSLRAALIKYANNESPLPEIVRFIISLIKNRKHDMQKKYKDILHDNSDAWRKDCSTEKPHVSMWKKKEIQKQKTREEIEAEKKEIEKKKEKSKFKDAVKNELDTTKKGLVNEGIKTAHDQFTGLISGFTNSLKGILPFGG